MAVVEEILRSEADGSISFGNHKLAKKAKVEDYEHAGDLLKVKTYNEIHIPDSVPYSPGMIPTTATQPVLNHSHSVMNSVKNLHILQVILLTLQL